MDTRLFDRSPLLGALGLLLGVAIYTLLLPETIGWGAALLSPRLLIPLIGDAHIRFWAWDQLVHIPALLLFSLPFAWAVAQLYRRRPLVAALLLVAPTAIWMVLDFLSQRDQLADAPTELNAIYMLDVAEVIFALPLLCHLLRPLPAP